jgi:hypothetical protein
MWVSAHYHAERDLLNYRPMGVPIDTTSRITPVHGQMAG